MGKGPEMDGSSAIERFREFLKEMSDCDVTQFAQQYPEVETFYFDLQELQEYDRELADEYHQHRHHYQEYFEDAVRYPVLHGEGYLRGARVTPNTALYHKPIHEFRGSEIGYVIGTDVRVEELDDPEMVIRAAAYYCENCGARNTVSPQLGSMREPYECDECDRRRVDFRLDQSQSEYIAYQTGTVVDADHLRGNYSSLTSHSIEFIGATVDRFDVGDWLRTVGVVSAEPIDSKKTTFEFAYRALSAELQAPEEIHEDKSSEEPAYSAYESGVADLKEDHLRGFYDHVHTIVEDRNGEQYTEEEAKTKIINPLLELLGWDLYTQDVRMEYKTVSGGAVDYALLGPDRDPAVFVEAKSPNSAVAYAALEQLYEYMVEEGAEWGLLTNGLKYKIIAGDTVPSPTVVGRFEYDGVHHYQNELETLHRAQFHTE